LFQDLSFALEPGDGVELVGPNGSGKTTLLNVLSGLLSPDRGDVCWGGVPIADCRSAYGASMTYIGHRAGVKDDLTALENLQVSGALAGVDLDPADLCAALTHLGLRDCARVHARHLSHGQRRRLALARLVACRRPLWLLDEAVTSLDAPSVRTVTTLIDAHLAAGGMAIVSTHQPLGDRARVVRRIDLAA
jgi:heme exporter protein A